MGLFGKKSEPEKKKEKAIASAIFTSLQSIGQIEKNWSVSISLYDDHLMFGGKNPIRLDYSQINDISYYSEKEVKEMAKSNAGRAVVGGLLFGPLGAVAGASGKKTKKETKYRGYLSIRYTSSDGEEKQLDFSEVDIIGGNVSSQYFFAQKFKKLVGLNKEITHL